MREEDVRKEALRIKDLVLIPFVVKGDDEKQLRMIIEASEIFSKGKSLLVGEIDLLFIEIERKLFREEMLSEFKEQGFDCPHPVELDGKITALQCVCDYPPDVK